MAFTFDWLDPWYPIDDATTQTALEAQLRREISSGHVLYGETAQLIARRSDTDDALFQLEGARVAEVHLTWRKSPEPDPRWPATAIFSSLDEWARDAMAPLHRALSGD
ncbi:hypothetical protein [Hyphomicrobium sp.]|uniref:hypothetical protein n=1 Tax=Hyphomicrobium sp. TaxID=82 RepID=UPI002E321BDC|nr:hypothetical protein [Hyphomicrobium sp.]HEX2842622.1 hypothetical protein [Hyphomicrobium sp.]